MKIGLAQINSTVGDFQKNAKRLIQAYRKSLDGGAELVVSPLGGLSGYPVGGLVYKSRFISQSKAVLEEIAKEVGETPFCVGYIDLNENQKGYFTDSVAILQYGKVVTRFDEVAPSESEASVTSERLVELVKQSIVWEYKKVRIGFIIGKDIGSQALEEEFFLKTEENPSVDLLITLSASAFQMNENVCRLRLIQLTAERLKAPVIYCNAVGGNDQLIFNGGSLVASDKGVLLAQGKEFEEEVFVANTKGGRIEYHSSDETERLFQALVLGVRDYVKKSGLRSVCLELKGDIDSAVSAVIAQEALGEKHVEGLFISDEPSCPEEHKDTLLLAERLKLSYHTIELSEHLFATSSAIAPTFKQKNSREPDSSMSARMRGIYLITLSESIGALPLATVNKSDLALGHCTIYGDMCGGLSIIGGLPKTLVYKLACWINSAEEIIPQGLIAKPLIREYLSPQIKQPSWSDEKMVDEVLELYIERGLSADEILTMTPYEEIFVRWVQRRVDLNQWKLIQAAPSFNVLKPFHKLKKSLPIAQRYQG